MKLKEKLLKESLQFYVPRFEISCLSLYLHALLVLICVPMISLIFLKSNSCLEASVWSFILVSKAVKGVSRLHLILEPTDLE